ncbi:universal stress protein [Streptomyces morookaense]|uniref:Universal stress protein n=1 Tax=Streptomyces morookaense TaxID=1970 RepID=A0A7Y7B7M8_STRMO|nr:universal stress protein [Streptomyces morookaense]NVK80540.1 universal stress protein [Streptomyces morookaense]GHF47103.1 universal stress protein [Streptomyces morookaense]
MAGVREPRAIVAGVAPDAGRRAAPAWAVDEAARRGAPLLLVHAQGTPTGGYRKTDVLPSWEQWNGALHEAGDRVLGEAVAFAESRRPGAEVAGLLAEGDPAWVLREQARDALLVVLGSSHLSRVQEVFSAASVALPVIAHSPCPVVVVPEREHAVAAPPYFVVGVDGSPESAAAVAFAFEEAALHGAALRAVYAWWRPEETGVMDEQAAEQEGRRILADATAEQAAARPDVGLELAVVRGHPVEALAGASEQALGLVVGTRGHGGFTGMLLGSVSQGVLHHARCPVVAVPHDGARSS